VLVFLGAVIAAAGALWGALQETAHQKQVTTLNIRLTEKSEEISGLTKQLATAQLEFAEEMRKKNEEIADLNRRTAATMTGGDSFCYLSLLGQKPGQPFLLLFSQQGEYPLYDVSVRVTNLEELEAKGLDYFTPENLAKDTMDIGSLAVGSAKQFGTMPMPAGDSIRLNIFFAARNGFFNQLLRAKKVGNEWIHATRVERNDEKGKTHILLERVPANFPRENDGSIKWE
jgi:hypothetical protein